MTADLLDFLRARASSLKDMLEHIKPLAAAYIDHPEFRD